MYLADNSINLPSFRIMGNKSIPGSPVVKILSVLPMGATTLVLVGKPDPARCSKKQNNGEHIFLMINYSMQKVITDNEIIKFFINAHISSILKTKIRKIDCYMFSKSYQNNQKVRREYVCIRDLNCE